jgi:enoyl-CoA hydratase/carnithine racemase
MQDRIRLTIADGIADVRLNRADKMNALDPAMFRAIAEPARGSRKIRVCALWCSPVKAGPFAPASTSRGSPP